MTEVRKTSPTGGQKGQKDDRQDLIAVPFLKELGLVCGFGAKKYDDDNWRKGYSWRLSYGAMQRHIQAMWAGEEKDQESGLPHLAHAAWHCMVLMTYSNDEKYAEFDDRPDVGVTLYKVIDGLQSQWQEEEAPQAPHTGNSAPFDYEPEGYPGPPEVTDGSQALTDLKPILGMYL